MHTSFLNSEKAFEWAKRNLLWSLKTHHQHGEQPTDGALAVEVHELYHN